MYYIPADTQIYTYGKLLTCPFYTHNEYVQTYQLKKNFLLANVPVFYAQWYLKTLAHIFSEKAEKNRVLLKRVFDLLFSYKIGFEVKSQFFKEVF